MSQELERITNHTPEVSSDAFHDLMRQAEAMSAAHKLSSVLCNTAMVPKAFRGKPDDGAAAILYGAEIGLQAQQALQQVFVIHGQPAIYARTMVALLKAKGFRFETTDASDQAVTVTGTSPRGETETSTWTIERAKKAGYTSNPKYQSDPQAMLYAKAASEVSRRLAPDVLLGIRYTAEDLELEPVKMQATRKDVRSQAESAPVPELTPRKAPQPQPKSDDDGLQAVLDEIAKIDAPEALTEFITEVKNTAEGISDDQMKQIKDAANTRWNQLKEK
ncbi:hypothetical protein QP924_09740 [Corynebacterium pseudodiphtheriticum]|uniref:hypothetical protein n=1 Tax=Corynebacterium pseudodiphtheriticum TaxID=37637 RepID=UPI00254B04BD|nr:hypothetical protein [Corynebacterium pseudodiphtheriticum]MDK8701116.1 hypothetical protein [Corynebacterium pseudodiphtheriticum]